MQEKKEEDLQQALNKAYEVGIDEVGRGCLAGPVYSAAVVLDQKTNFGSKDFNQINDSKKLSEKKREKL